MDVSVRAVFSSWIAQTHRSTSGPPSDGRLGVSAALEVGQAHHFSSGFWVPPSRGLSTPAWKTPLFLFPGVKRAGCPEGAPRPQSLASCRDCQGRSLSPQHQISWRSWPLFLPLLLIELICYQASKGREVPPSRGTGADSLVPASYPCFLD